MPRHTPSIHESDTCPDKRVVWRDIRAKRRAGGSVQVVGAEPVPNGAETERLSDSACVFFLCYPLPFCLYEREPFPFFLQL